MVLKGVEPNTVVKMSLFIILKKETSLIERSRGSKNGEGGRRRGAGGRRREGD